MATSLETDAFLNAFVRMTARKGWPTKMLSDNGTNFVGAEKEIRELVSQLDHDQLQHMTSSRGVTWHWNPPQGPHFGGVFESMIKSAKRAIYAVLKDADINDEELETFIGVESLMNSRPLTTVSDDPNDDQYSHRITSSLVGWVAISFLKVWIALHLVHADAGGECKS